jgi:predicted Zn-dependent protease
MRLSRRIALLLVFLLPILSSCETTGINARQINIVSNEEEVRLGKNLAAEVDKEHPILEDPLLTAYVTRIGQSVARHSDRADVPYSFKVIDNDKEINAFALPGGPVYVNSGLLKAAENEAEVAGVLGHEVAHIAARHSTEQLTKRYGFAIVAQLILGKDPGLAAEIGRDIVGSLGMLKFSRDDEIEADRLGVRYMYRAGYNPEAMVSFQEKLARLQSGKSSRVLSFLSTHPMSQNRIDAIKQEIAALPRGKDVGFYAERYRKYVIQEKQ